LSCGLQPNMMGLVLLSLVLVCMCVPWCVCHCAQVYIGRARVAGTWTVC
jgi:hypothetical protein